MDEIETIMGGFDEDEACPCLIRHYWLRRLVKSKLCKFLTMYFGLIFVWSTVSILFYVDANYCCPAYYDGDSEQCRIPIYIACFFMLEMVINIVMFHYTFKSNRVDSLVPMSILLRKGEEYRNSARFVEDMTSTNVRNHQNMISNDKNHHHDKDITKPKYCHTCQIIVPDRCHHCPLCNCCVMKKDHHCFVTGACVGFANQRHFVIFLFWTMLGAFYSLLWLVRYLNKFYIPFLPFGFLHYILPTPIVKWIIGSCTFTQMCYVLLLNLGLYSISGALVFFGAQWYLILKNITMYERMKKQYIQQETLSTLERLKLVFGPMCVLNFIFPMPFKNRKDKSLERFLIECGTNDV